VERGGDLGRLGRAHRHRRLVGVEPVGLTGITPSRAV
jgi:hypothetical protein